MQANLAQCVPPVYLHVHSSSPASLVQICLFRFAARCRMLGGSFVGRSSARSVGFSHGPMAFGKIVNRLRRPSAKAATVPATPAAGASSISPPLQPLWQPARNLAKQTNKQNKQTNQQTKKQTNTQTHIQFNIEPRTDLVRPTS